jgi:hypothetical protein
MLEHMGETCLSPCFIPRSHAIPDLEGDQRSLMIFKEDHLQAIGQDSFKNLFFEPGHRKGYGNKAKEKDEKT